MTSRRSFIKKSLVAASGTLVLPTILPSCSRWKGANDRLNVAHVGVGSRGTDEMLNYVLPFDQFRSVAVCDVFKSRSENAAQKVIEKYESAGINNPQCDTYTDYRRLLERDDIDIVAITTSDHWHLPVAIHSAQSGKHVHVNKPLGLSIEYMKILKKELANNKLKFNYGSQQRSYSFMKKAISYIKAGDLGEIQKVYVWAPGGGMNRHIGYYKEMPVPSDLDYNMWLGPAPEALYTADRVHRDGSFFINDYSIGFLGGWGSHPLDVMVWALKDKISTDFTVSAKGDIHWPEGSMYNNINIWDAEIKFKNGPDLHFLSQDKAKSLVMKYQSDYRQNGTLFVGSKGWLTLSRTYAESDIPEINAAINDFPKKSFGLDGDRGRHFVEFASLIKGEQDSYMDVDDAILSDTISHLSNAAIRLDKNLDWDYATKKVRNYPQANKLLNRDHRQPFGV